ncbi:MAG: GNAT family N-acetyltransferase [Erysipelotrichaceae bacterium]|nr:GNAT family N-acetyltransferase [Erysipelotrichaceae bacterium]
MNFIKSGEMKVSVTGEQERQISSKDNIRKALLEDNVIGFDIYDDTVLIGFAMLRKYDEGCYFLWDYAIDKEYQNRHYGTRALKQLIEMMQNEYGLKEMSTTYIWGNEHARYVYESVGFRETDVVDEDGIHEVNMLYQVV